MSHHLFLFFSLKRFLTSLIMLCTIFNFFQALNYSLLYVVKKNCLIFLRNKNLLKLLKNDIFMVVQMISSDFRQFIKILCKL